MSYEKFMAARKDFVSKFDNFAPRDNVGDDLHVKELVDEYKEILQDLEERKNKVEKVLSLGDVDYKLTEQRKYYPTSLKNYHGRRAAIITALTSGAATAGLLFLIGQGNPALWTTSLVGTCIGMSLPVGIGAAALPTVPSVKKFLNAQKNRTPAKVRERVLGLKFLAFQNNILESEKKKRRAFSSLALNVKPNIEAILTGTLSLQKEVTIEKKGANDKDPNQKSVKTKFEYRDEFKDLNGLPFFMKRKINKTLSAYSEQVTRLKKLQLTLSNYIPETNSKENKQANLEERNQQETYQNTATVHEAQIRQTTSQNDISKAQLKQQILLKLKEEEKKKRETQQNAALRTAQTLQAEQKNVTQRNQPANSKNTNGVKPYYSSVQKKKNPTSKQVVPAVKRVKSSSAGVHSNIDIDARKPVRNNEQTKRSYKGGKNIKSSNPPSNSGSRR